MSPETIERRLFSKWLRQGFLGVDYLDKTFCPLAIPGVSFDETEPACVAPFTPEEVGQSVGFVELRRRFVDSWDGEATSGIVDGVFVSTRYTLHQYQFAIRVPRSAPDPLETLETYEDRCIVLLEGIRVVYPGPPKIFFRQPVKHAPRKRGDTTNDGSWYETWIEVLLRRQERRPHQGVQEVTL